MLFIDTITLLYDIKCHVNEDFSNHSAKSKYYDDSNISVICKIKHEIDGVAIEECFGLKPDVFVSGRWVVSMNKQNVRVKVLLQQEVKVNIKIICCIINVWGIQWTESQIKIIKWKTYKINKCFLSCFVDKIYTLNNGYNELSFGY